MGRAGIRHTTMKKFIIIGDWVTSKNDGDKHYVNARELCRLYGFNPDECFLIESNNPLFEETMRGLPRLPVLEIGRAHV